MNKEITLHTIATYNDKEYELQDLLNNLLNELQRKDNIIEEFKQNKRDYERENILEMKLHILDNNWKRLKEYVDKLYEDETYHSIGEVLDKIEELESGE